MVNEEVKSIEDRVYHVLMVEDNPNHFKILQRFIKKSGKLIEVDHVESAPEFFNVYLAKNYDLLMIDYNLAQYTGLSILQKLSALDLETPIIIVTQQKDPEIAINAMKHGAADYIIKSKENFKYLPEKIIHYIHEYESELETNDVFKFRRQSLMRNPDVKRFIRAFTDAKLSELNPRSETHFFFEPKLSEDFEKEKFEKILQALTVNRILNKKPMAVKVVCPRCEGDNIETRPVCPTCGGNIFIKNTDVKGDPFRCLSGCGETFGEVKSSYRCNDCTKVFPQSESKYRHIYSFTVNKPLLLELKEVLNNTDELKIWEEKSKQYKKNIEDTKKMQNEIKAQLKELIKQQIKRN